MSVPGKPHILVADDDAAMRELVARWLQGAGYSVATAVDGMQVIRLVQKAEPAAIVMDLTMPGMDGFQVLAKLSELGLQQAPVLMLTGRNLAEDVRKAVMLGAKDYLAKPVQRAQLVDRVERMLRTRRSQPEPSGGSSAEEHLLD